MFLKKKAVNHDKMSRLSLQQIQELWDKYQVPKNIRQHSIKVTKLSLDLAQKIKNQGLSIDLDLIYNSGMLHDIAKFLCLQNDNRHPKEGARILKEHGLKKEAEIVLKHGLDEIFEPDSLDSWEAKIVYYADKRVVHDKITTLSEKFKYMKKRYARHLKEIEKAEPKVYELEKELISNF